MKQMLFPKTIHYWQREVGIGRFLMERREGEISNQMTLNKAAQGVGRTLGV
jgi:hypothetical protein